MVCVVGPAVGRIRRCGIGIRLVGMDEHVIVLRSPVVGPLRARHPKLRPSPLPRRRPRSALSGPPWPPPWLRLVGASSSLPVLVVAVRAVRPPRFRPPPGSLCFPVYDVWVGADGLEPPTCSL